MNIQYIFFVFLFASFAQMVGMDEPVKINKMAISFLINPVSGPEGGHVIVTPVVTPVCQQPVVLNLVLTWKGRGKR